MKVSDHHLNLLFDLLVAEENVTIGRIANRLDVTVRQAHQAIHELRRLFGEESDINVVTESRGWGQPHVYTLVGNFKDAQEWILVRLGDAETRLATIHAVAKSAARGFDPDGFMGLQARALELTLRQSMEHLSLLLRHDEVMT